MARGRKKTIQESIEEKIARLNAEIEELNASLKEKKKELKKTIRDKEKEERIAAEKKAEEDKAKLVEAVQSAVNNGEKTIDEILDFLK